MAADNDSGFSAVQLTISGPSHLNSGGRKSVILRPAHKEVHETALAGQWAACSAVVFLIFVTGI